MRPLRLQVEGFACFKDRQELDLSSLDLFAITGPTGAGKSSLLDAMLFALFGVIPRVGAQNHDQLISHGRPRMAVVLDFRTGGRVFRVTRVRRRKGPAQAQLEELRDGGEKSIADGVTMVEGEVRKQLGLSYDAFAQAVVLPQGEFMRFLKPDSPGKRRVILRDLLRLGVYERMRQRASERAAQLEQHVAELDRRLREDYVGATPEALAARRESHTQVAQDLSAATAELEQGRRTLDALRLVHTLAVELVARQAELSRLTARTPEITAAEVRTQAARRAAPVIALARAGDESCRHAETLAARLAEAAETRTRAEVRQGETRQRLAGAEAASAAIGPLRDRLRQLDEVTGLVQGRSSALARQAKAEEEHDRLVSDHRSAVAEAQAAAARAETRVRALAEADGRVREIPYDAELAARLDSVRDVATALTGLRRHVLSLDAAAQRGHEAAGKAAAALAQCRAEAEETAGRHADAWRGLEAADLAWHEAERAHMALTLRNALAPGEPCPVCAQPVAIVPVIAGPPELETLAQDRKAARAAEARARAAAEASRLAAAAADARAAEAGQANDRAREQAAHAHLELATAEESLAAAVGTLVAEEPGLTLEKRIAECVRRLAARRAEHEHAVTARQHAERDLDAARHEVRQAQQLAEDLSRQADSAAERMREVRAEVVRLDREIKRVTEDPDPLAERKRVAAQHDQLLHDLEASRRDESTAAIDLAAAVAAHEAARRAAEEAAHTAASARVRVREQALEAGFSDELAARTASLESTEIERLTREIETHRREVHAVEGRVAELMSELGGRQVTDEQVRDAARRIDEQQRAAETLQRREAQLEREIETLAERVARAETITRELATARTDHALQRRLADDLRNERFQAFVLEETFRELAAGASERLRRLSGRYTLEFKDDTFVVVDHDNAGERRSADTLSGGETFLTSLALALELSEQVQRAAGAVPLDSLFIDEGFGTLDPETLETVAAAIETLPLGGRMVGIITHVRELAYRLPARVVVEKRTDGSRLRSEGE